MAEAPELTYEAAFPGRFTKAALLNGRHVTVTIDKAYMEVLEGDKGKENKLLMAFRGAKMELVVNKTNAFCLKEMFGNKIKEWVGKRITIYPTEVNFGPKKVPAIRIYGSPDINGDVEVSARIGRKPLKTTLKRVRPGEHGFKGEAVKASTEPEQPAGESSGPGFVFVPEPATGDAYEEA